MGFLLGSFCICKSPFHQSLPPSFLTTSQRRNGKKKIISMAYFRPENPTDSNFMERRPFLLMGLSALPFLQSRANAVESLVEGKLGFIFSFSSFSDNPFCFSSRNEG